MKTKTKRHLGKIIYYNLLFVLVLSCTSNSNTLVNNGHTDYEIVLPKDASNKIQKAGEQLQFYVEKITDVRIPIVRNNEATSNKNYIYLKTNPDQKHQIQIESIDKNIFISGWHEEAVQNGVYEFLEAYLNCKWYSPTVEDIPTLKVLKLAQFESYFYTPPITTRTVHSRLFYQNESFANKHKVTTLAFPKYAPSARVHTFHKFLPEEKFFEEHPDYFALRNGKRVPTQLCLTNPEVLDIVKDSVSSLFKRYPNSSVVSVSQDDNQQHCLCQNCKAIDFEEGSPSGTMIQFVNKVAADFPDKTISTLAYQYTRKPCKTKPLPNVLITLCSIECDRSGSIEEKCPDFSEDLKGWGKLTENIRIWDYTTQFTNFLAPFPNLQTIEPNISFFKENNAKWIFEQHSNNPSELFELRSYVMAKLLWNPKLKMDDLISEFTNGYYKEAGIYIKEYIDLIHAKINEDPDFFLFLYGDPSQAFDSYLNSDLLEQYNELFNEAINAVKYNDDLIQRVNSAKLGVSYAILEACKKSISSKFRLVNKDADDNPQINPFVKEELTNFHKTCKNENISLMNEMGFTVQEYVNNYNIALEVVMKPNKGLGKKVILLTKPKKYANENPQVLTDGAIGGNSFYANWLGFEGNHMEAIVDLGQEMPISSISTAFLQVTNHVVFFPIDVTYSISNDGKKFKPIGIVKNDYPLIKKSKVNDIKYFNLIINEVKTRYIKVFAKSMKQPPYWHHAAGTKSWIFADEIIID
ncbi:DUF4838 domain-containing protein [Urechidicola vernalis]|uniref:DUF4838 domain-containing protein n=1 Tax=Urechidicola vernalis TaxID=3075600 RepID=A0ABU2Y4V8_9FLAO|nr:DUF4838 domain-containing protein [Urechidicola sp. P050]MDT0553223.1 DUF4838 domain-containing protein [Urechidicola sp. P050]